MAGEMIMTEPKERVCTRTSWAGIRTDAKGRMQHWIRAIELPGDVSVDVRVDRMGKFTATWNGMDFEADTRQALADKVTAAERKTSKVKIEFPFTIIQYGTSAPEQVTATGIHGGSGNVTYRTGTQVRQADKYHSRARGGMYYRRFTQDEIEYLATRRAELAEKEAAINAFLDERRIDLTSEVRRLIAEKEAERDG